MSRFRPAVAALLAATAIPAAFASSASAADAKCNPLSTKTCLAPFPSNYWAKADPSSPTGLRADVTDDVLRPEILNALPKEDGISPTGVFGGASGFSAGAGAVFEFTEKPGAVPYDGGDAVVAYDLDTGQRVKVHAFMSPQALNTNLVSKASNALQVFPQSRWAFGHRILVAVTDQFPIARPTEPAFSELAAQEPANQRAADYVQEVRDGLAQSGIAESSVRNATVFTVRAREEFLAPTERLMADTAARPHPVRGLSISWDLINPDVGGLVTGQLRVDNYRTRNGTGPVDWSGATRKDEWIPFRLTLPETSTKGLAGVVLYMHGIGAFKEMDPVVTQMNAQRGFATFSVDWPNHGARSGPNGGNLLQLLAPGNLGKLGGMFNQATIDLMGVYKALQTMKIDFMKPVSFFSPFGQGRDGRNDINNAKIAMEGTSLGGVLGLNFAALSPSLKGVIFHVTGAGIGHAISQTVLWNIFGAILPKAATGTEATVLQAAIQQVLDPADGINTAEFIRNPRPGQSAKPLLIIAGDGDNVVPSPTTVSLANLLDLPLVGPQLYGMPDVRRTASYDAGGYGVRQYPPFTGPITLPLISGSSSHGVFLNPSAYTAQHAFIATYFNR